MKIKLYFLFLLVFGVSAAQLPKEFVYVKDVVPSIKVELRYFSNNNFLGVPVDSYKKDVAILTIKAANALKQIQEELKQHNLSIMIYDSYRPQTAVNHFVRWAKNLSDTINKESYYPNVMKQHLFKEGYIASKSGHSRGSTLDITLVDLNTCEPIDMGSPYDYFGPESWVANNNLTVQQRASRMLLQTIMLKYGFRNYPQEWWHFTLKDEPFPDTYFDFPVD
jgi:D-alanyl-D-alanine dipeptidase